MKLQEYISKNIKILPTVNEAISSNDMKDYILNRVVDMEDKHVSHIYNYIRAHGGDEKIYDFLKEKFAIGGDAIMKSIIRIAIDNGCIEDMENIADGGPLITWDAFEKGDNIMKLIHDLGYGVNDEFIKDMMDLRMKLSGKDVGEGEALLQLFLVGGHMSKVGDVAVDKDKIVEIKSTDAHFTGQTGWGKGSSVSKYFLSHIADYPELYDIYKKYEKTFERDKYQMWYKSDVSINKSGFCGFITEAKDNNLYGKLLQIVSNSISELYTDDSVLSAEDILKFLTNVDIFDEKNKKINGVKVCNCLGALDLYYYMGKEKSFTHLCIIGGVKSSNTRRYKYKLFSRNEFSSPENAYDQICNYIDADAPNTKSTSTPQDSFVAINIKG